MFQADVDRRVGDNEVHPSIPGSRCDFGKAQGLDAEMVSGLGINLTPINTLCFLFGSFVAGAGAVIGVQLFGSVTFNDGMDMLLVAIAVVVVGGVGKVQGALVGALIIGIIDTFGRVYFPQIAEYSMYMLLILILIVRPSGILGRSL